MPATPTRKPRTGNGPCSRRIGRTRWPKTSNSTPGAIRHELELGHEARRPLLRPGPERITEHPPDRLLGLLLAINRHRPADPSRKQPRVVEPEQVVGMVMRECDRVHLPDPLAQQLHPHLRRRVDQQVAARKRKQDARPGALISRIARSADRALAADHGNACGCPCPEKDQPAHPATAGSVNRPVLNRIRIDRVDTAPASISRAPAACRRLPPLFYDNAVPAAMRPACLAGIRFFCPDRRTAQRTRCCHRSGRRGDGCPQPLVAGGPGNVIFA